MVAMEGTKANAAFEAAAYIDAAPMICNLGTPDRRR